MKNITLTTKIKIARFLFGNVLNEVWLMGYKSGYNDCREKDVKDIKSFINNEMLKNERNHPKRVYEHHKEAKVKV